MSTAPNFVVHCLVDCGKCSGLYRERKTGRRMPCRCACHTDNKDGAPYLDTREGRAVPQQPSQTLEEELHYHD